MVFCWWSNSQGMCTTPQSHHPMNSVQNPVLLDLLECTLGLDDFCLRFGAEEHTLNRIVLLSWCLSLYMTLPCFGGTFHSGEFIAAKTEQSPLWAYAIVCTALFGSTCWLLLISGVTFWRPALIITDPTSTGLSPATSDRKFSEWVRIKKGQMCLGKLKTSDVCMHAVIATEERS